MVAILTGFFTGRLSAQKLEQALNLHSGDGWRFAKSIHERKRWLILFGREAHFLVFERETDRGPSSQSTTLSDLPKDENGSLFFFVILIIIAGILAYFVSQYAR